MRNHTTLSRATGLLLGFVALGAAAQTPPPPEVNHNVGGWMSNRPFGTPTADSYVCSPGGTAPVTGPGNVALPVADRYDGAMITPGDLAVSDISKLVPVVPPLSLVSFDNLDLSAEIYVDYPFTTTGTFPDRDVVLNQAFYSMNQGPARYGSQFHVRMVLVDGTNEYPLGGTTPVGAAAALSPDGIYFFVSNQTWPLTGAASPITTIGCTAFGKTADQGIAGTVQVPVPLQPGHAYALRAYIGLDANATDRKAMMDDVMLFMQTVAVTASNDGLLPGGAVDPAYSFAALNGGTTPSVLANDTVNAADATTVPAANLALTQVSADLGLTLNPDGTIAVAPGQAGTKTLTYRLCPNYGTVVPGFQSAACKTAVAPGPMTGPGVVIPPVPTLQQGALALMGLLTAGAAALGLRRRRQGS